MGVGDGRAVGPRRVDGVEVAHPAPPAQRVVDDLRAGADVAAGQAQVAGDVVAGAHGDEAQRHAGARHDVQAQVDHAVAAHDDERVQPPGVLQQAGGARAGLLVVGALDEQDVVAGAQQGAAGGLGRAVVAAAPGTGIGDKTDAHGMGAKR